MRIGAFGVWIDHWNGSQDNARPCGSTPAGYPLDTACLNPLSTEPEGHVAVAVRVGDRSGHIPERIVDLAPVPEPAWQELHLQRSAPVLPCDDRAGRRQTAVVLDVEDAARGFLPQRLGRLRRCRFSRRLASLASSAGRR
jgi:hypothetical protein